MFHHEAHAVTAPQQDHASPAEAMRKAVEVAQTYSGLTDGPLALKPGELRYFTLNGAALIEPTRAPSRRVGGYAGPSIRVAKGLYMHAGGYSGKTIPGEVRPTVIDTGTAVVTDRRIVFLGEKVTREFDWAKMLAWEHDEATRSTAFHVSNRQTVDAIRWGTASAFTFFVDLAHAHYAGTVEQFVATLEHEAATTG